MTPADIDRQTWAQFFPEFARAYKVSAESADHVTIIGPTGTGKTTLAMTVASLRRYVATVGTKPRDAHFGRLLRDQGYLIRRNDDSTLPSPKVAPRFCIWPKHTENELADRRRHNRTFGRLMNQAYIAGSWHVVIEEGSHLVDLGLNETLRRHLRLGRSQASGLIMCSQRPRHIPLEAISGAQHLFIFGTNDDEDLKRLSGMNGMSSRLVRETVAGLGRDYHFLYINTRSGRLCISKYQPPTKATSTV